MNSKIIYWIILLLSLVGLGVTTYQTIEHYFLSSSVCDFTASFSCSIVTESRFGEFPINSGVSTALWGIPWWIILGFLAWRGIGKKKKQFKFHEFFVLLWALTGMAFVIYLLIIEFFILPKETGFLVICPLCTVQHATILLVILLSMMILKQPLSRYLKKILFIGKELNPRPFFILGILGVIFVPGYFILGGGQKEVDHYDFASCLAEKKVTMYGFTACPNCNKQEHIIGVNAFEEYIKNTGLYVKCRPESEGNTPIGDRLANISILEKYRNAITPETTQSQLCAMMVGRGTPTWVYDNKQIDGWQTIPDLAEFTGCPVPSNFKGQTTGSGGVSIIE